MSDQRLPIVFTAFAALVGMVFWVTVAVVCVAVAVYCLAAIVLVPLMLIMILWAVTDGWIAVMAILGLLCYGMSKIYNGEW